MDLKRTMFGEKKPISKVHILYDCVYMTFWKMQNYTGENRSVVARVMGWGEGHQKGGFFKNLFCIFYWHIVDLQCCVYS